MEWVETTGKNLDEARERALDQLGVAADEAEFDVLDEPRSGLFGRVRGEARVRARVKPAAVRPKQDRRRKGRETKRSEGRDESAPSEPSGDPAGAESTGGRPAKSSAAGRRRGGRERDGSNGSRPAQQRQDEPRQDQSRQVQPQDRREETSVSDEPTSTVSPQEVGDAAVAFITGLSDAFGVKSTTHLEVDEAELDVRVEGDELGLMIGPGGRTLLAIQDLARVASQRRLGDHETRLRIDVAGYREKRRAALEKFARGVAEQVVQTGTARALEPMPSADRKAIHDALHEVDGVVSRSEGDDPARRVVIAPA